MDRKNSSKHLKEALRSGSYTLGSWLTLGQTIVGELLMDAGCEWVVVDNEHSMMSLESIQNALLAVQAKNGVALVRLSHNHGSEIRKILDAGADGIMCPMVNSKEDAILLINNAKYPPLGKRSYGLWRGQGYGLTSKEYFEHANEDTTVIIQIEHIDGVNQIDEILSVNGIDGVLTGPYDLSGSLNIPGQLTHPKVIEAEKRVLEACRKHGVAAGAHLVHPTPEALQAKIDLGYTFIALGADFLYIRDGMAKAKKEFDQRTKRT
jgi:2-dehydro-3-deoxyglucarate aldolase